MAEKEFVLIESQEALVEFGRENRAAPWMCMDTEFVGEKRFVTRLCLIQVSTPLGNYLIDPFALKDLRPFLELIEDPAVLKITHAGENDYRILYEQYGVLPRNAADTQIAAGLAGYKYPVSLRKLVELELRWRLKKDFTVADWESRPFKRKQLKYALEDILPLHDLWQKLERRLEQMQRLDWAREEFRQLEQAASYARDPYKEVMDSRMIRSLNTQEQIFLVRLYEWRRKVAEEKNHSKEMVLPNRLFSHIVRSIPSGREALKNNRRIPEKIVARHGDTFEKLYGQAITPEERQLLRQITHEDEEDPREEIFMELLYLAIKYKCQQEEVSPNLAMPRALLKKMRYNPDLAEELLAEGWRGQFLGASFIRWLKNFDRLEMQIQEDVIAVRVAQNGNNGKPHRQ